MSEYVTTNRETLILRDFLMISAESQMRRSGGGGVSQATTKLDPSPAKLKSRRAPGYKDAYVHLMLTLLYLINYIQVVGYPYYSH